MIPIRSLEYNVNNNNDDDDNNNKQSFDEVFVISEIIKVEVSVINRAEGRG